MTQQELAPDLRRQIIDLLPRLRRFALSLTGSLEDAEDLLHTTVEKALSKLDQYERGTNLDRWMFRICKNTWFDEWRQRKSRGTQVDPEEAGHEPAYDGEADATQKLEVEEVKKAMATLPEEQRMMLVLVVVEGYSYKEVAAMLDMPIGTVMSRLARARKKLANTLRPPGETSSPPDSTRRETPEGEAP